MPQTVLCSSTRRKWWRRILRRRLCVDLHNSDTASVRLDGSTHDGAGQRAQSRCSCPRRGAFFSPSLGEAYHWRSAQTRTVSSAAVSRYLSRRRRCPKLFVCPKRRSPPFSVDTRAGGGDFVKGGPGCDWIASRNRKTGRLGGQGRARGAWTFLQQRKSSQKTGQGRLGRCAAAGSTQILRNKGQSGRDPNQKEPKKSRRRWTVQRSDRGVGQESMSRVIESPVCALAGSCLVCDPAVA